MIFSSLPGSRLGLFVAMQVQYSLSEAVSSVDANMLVRVLDTRTSTFAVIDISFSGITEVLLLVYDGIIHYFSRALVSLAGVSCGGGHFPWKSSLPSHTLVFSRRHVYFPVLSTRPLHTNSGCGKKEAHIINWSMVMQRQHPFLGLP